MSAKVRTELFSIFSPLHRLKRTVTMDEWLAVKAERYLEIFFRCGEPRSAHGPANPIYRVDISPRGATSAISAINFLMSKLPKELKSFATRTKAPGPPITLSR